MHIGVASTTWVFVSLLLGGLMACGEASDADSVSSGSTPSLSETPSASSSADGVRISVTTHCGIRGVTVARRVWLADPILGDDSNNPPAGWDENEEIGSFVQTSATSATFTTDDGLTADFRLAKVGTADPNEGCE